MRSFKRLYINQLLNGLLFSYGSVTSVVKTQTKITREQVNIHGTDVEFGNLMAKNHGPAGQGSHPRLLTLTEGSRHTAESHQPVVSGAPPKITGPIWPSWAKNSLPNMWKEWH
jgi:hypothetical protein